MRGMTLVDVVVGTAIMLLVFLSIFSAYRLAIDLVYSTKAKTGAVSLVSQQLEYIRGLPYDSVGTIGGIPAGTLSQATTTKINNIPYTLRTIVLYADAPEDGTGAADTNHITADYKLLKVEALWSIRGQTRSTYAVSRVSPHGMESLSAGGTLRINVFDAAALPVADAVVRIQNASTSPAVDITVQTADDGSVAVPGAPVASNYRITVTKTGYSSAQTYDTSTANPNPSPAHLAVLNQQTTTISFAIDRTGTLSITTYEPPPVESTSTDPVLLSGVAMNILGSKVIGATNTGTPVYKTSLVGTSTNGTIFVSPIEWDSYAITPNAAYDVRERCPEPVSVTPNSTLGVSFLLVPHTSNSLRVIVTASSSPLSGASVTLGSETKTTSSCGQVFFGSLTSGTRTLSVTATGHGSSTQDVMISGSSVTTIPLP